jgi:hypothetical protein
MGWSFKTIETSKKDFVAECLKNCTWSSATTEYAVLKHRVVGNNLWMAVSVTCLCTGLVSKEVMLFLLASHNKCWGYKDVSESMGPVEVNCPEAIIKAVGPTNHPYAIAWRERVKAYHEAKAASRAAAKAVKVGCKVTVKYSKGLYTVCSVTPEKILAYGENGMLYRVPKSRITAVTA